ncbi:hypothetical protein LLH06_17050 [Mucilaginibacter daejeonensis]|uniref:hypothetical protein n=1 Tax=Mucilaginibacter daejeonensis TaxID=398049 RepID=UPI001D17B89C|nr:hypothetical protein [Mucilaginibacter daejeonensis]UEG52660.1 hypothetical protein LLH06_17050 [Mucilaginibacter daejeonensis]
MASVVCTLFEGSYHIGVAVLINSLYNNGYRGDVYAGYKGSLPHWTDQAVQVEGEVAGTKKLTVNSDLSVYFLPVDTKYHLTNYKPDFMLGLLNGYGKNADAVFYYDPDIVQQAPWSFMDEWVNCGVAVCEDVNSPVEEYNPKRVFWRTYFKGYGQELSFKTNIYVNGGFVGVHRNSLAFLEHWKQVQENMAHDIGGLEIAIFNKGKKIPSGKMNNFYAFGKTDQDALNATIELHDGAVSFQRKEAMGFGPGLTLMPHAVGGDKPWNKRILTSWLKKGSKPSSVDKAYWENASGIITVYSLGKLKTQKMKLKLVAFLSRFYSK